VLSRKQKYFLSTGFIAGFDRPDVDVTGRNKTYIGGQKTGFFVEFHKGPIRGHQDQIQPLTFLLKKYFSIIFLLTITLKYMF
jgi:hypothetical protein